MLYKDYTQSEWKGWLWFSTFLTFKVLFHLMIPQDNFQSNFSKLSQKEIQRLFLLLKLNQTYMNPLLMELFGRVN